MDNNQLQYCIDKNKIPLLESIKQFSTDIWASGTINHPYYTLHGPQHSKQIETIIFHLLAPEHLDHHRIEDIIKEEELFILLAAVWLHDIGMIIPLTEEEDRIIKNSQLTEQEYIRKEHHNRSYDYVISHKEKIGLKLYESEYVGTICKAHREINLLELPDGFPNLRFLGALLRIADELDITNTRTPEQLLEICWDNLDDTSKWHWLKHTCVIDCTHEHIELKDYCPTRLLLQYRYIISLPHSSFMATFWTQIITPIKRVLESESVNIILNTKRIGVAYDKFTYYCVTSNQILPDGTYVEDILNELLKQVQIKDDLEQVLHLYKTLNPVVSVIIERECQNILYFSSQSQSINQVKELICKYLFDLMSTDIADNMDQIRNNFRKDSLILISKLPAEDIFSELLNVHILKLADMAWRLKNYIIGDESKRNLHLRHLAWGNCVEILELLEWIIQNESSRGIKLLSIEFLNKLKNDSSFKALLKATNDQYPEVRIEALNALKDMNGPGIYEIIGAIADRDVDGKVRQTARNVLKSILENKEKNESKIVNKRILIIDQDQYIISALTDALINQNMAEVVVKTDLSEVKKVITEWKPDLIICELIIYNTTTEQCQYNTVELAGLRILRCIREHIDNAIPIIATSTIDPDSVSVNLFKLNCVYIRKPTTIDVYLKTIYTLLKKD